MRKVLRALLAAAANLLLLSALLLGIASWLEYRPTPQEVVFQSVSATPIPDTLTLLSWNIGYGGLGDNMDFFYDGGHAVRDTKGRTEQNLNRIIATLREADADVMLLQEVDLSSHRTYGINEVELLRRAFPEYTLSFAYNYKARFVPIPLRKPIGKVEGGVVILSRAVPVEVIRYQYPSQFPWPTRLFNLKRCLLSARFVTTDGKSVFINNTHNTAYDTGGMRRAEMDFLGRLLAGESHGGYPSVTGGDWNQFPPRYTPRAAELANPDFVPQPIDSTLFEDGFRFVYDTQNASLRYLNEPYGPHTTTTLTDFFLLSPQVRVLELKTLPEEFRASDHNPVWVRVALF